jgi:hypothetical protein
MFNSLRSSLIVSSLAAAFFLIGCGGGDTSSDTSVTATTVDGQLVDSYVENVDYICTDGVVHQTDKDGKFSCKSLPVTFKLGGLKLGAVAALASDKHVFPQDIFGVERSDVNDTNVIAMARLLQSADENNNSSDGLKIPQAVKDAFVNEEDFNASALELYAADANITLIDADLAVEHLSDTTQFVEEVTNALLTPKSTLSQELKNTLSYMGNEERLAHDIYLKLYETYPLSQLKNVATNSETQHIEAVQLLIQKYIADVSEFTNIIDGAELNYKYTDVSDMEMGVYDVQAIQDLYNALLARGSVSQQAALEVGCIVEVTDINDLNEDIALAEESNATDIVSTFTFLRNGSYNHYWAFDGALKSKGITNGCCVLGSEYCKNYPTK